MHDRVLFLKGQPNSAPISPLIPIGYEAVFWRPSLKSVCPPGQSLYPFLVWTLFHALRVFGNREYGVFLIRRSNRWVHRSVVTPRFFRFPFMGSDDLQVGDVWTAESDRGRGLATFALLTILQADHNRQRTYWYLTDESNLASTRVAEHAKFFAAASGTRTRYFGVRLFGAYRIHEQLPLA